MLSLFEIFKRKPKYKIHVSDLSDLPIKVIFTSVEGHKHDRWFKNVEVAEKFVEEHYLLVKKVMEANNG
jgi:hypothetical protein